MSAHGGLRRAHLTGPLLRLAVGRVKLCPSIEARHVSGLLELVVTGVLVWSVFILLSFFSFPRWRRLCLLVLELAGGALATLLPASSFTTISGLFFVASLVLRPLLLGKLFDLPTVLEVVTHGAVDLAALGVGALQFVGGR